MENPLVAVQQLGQSIWYDNIQRSLITSGDLRAMVEHDGLLGMTSNPAIFEKALTGSADYDQPMQALVEQGVGSAIDVYERLTTTVHRWPYPCRTHRRRCYIRDGCISLRRRREKEAWRERTRN